MFELVSKYKPSGDQPEAIKKLVEGIKEGKKEHFKKQKSKNSEAKRAREKDFGI